MKNLFSTIQAAEYLNLSVPAVKYHLKQGNIKPEKIGNSLVFTKAQLDEFIQNKRPQGRPTKEKV